MEVEVGPGDRLFMSAGGTRTVALGVDLGDLLQLRRAARQHQAPADLTRTSGPVGVQCAGITVAQRKRSRHPCPAAAAASTDAMGIGRSATWARSPAAYARRWSGRRG